MCQRLFFGQRLNRSDFLKICAVFRHIIEDVVDRIGDPFLEVCHELAPFRVSEEIDTGLNTSAMSSVSKLYGSMSMRKTPPFGGEAYVAVIDHDEAFALQPFEHRTPLVDNGK